MKSELHRQYVLRFGGQEEYRNSVWKILTADFFQPFIQPNSTVLDLGCGWGEFINNIQAAKKYGMDLNADAKRRLTPEVEFIEHDCSEDWPLPANSLDCVFTSNFFEHLPGKRDLHRTIAQIHRCLRSGARVICIGPNIRYLEGEYWDFLDHHLPLTERSLAEAFEIQGFRIERAVPRFLPYRMVRHARVPLWLIRPYCQLRMAWWLFGKQFLVMASKQPANPDCRK